MQNVDFYTFPSEQNQHAGWFSYIFANSQMFYAGTKTYAVLKWKIAKRFIAQSKIAYTKYTDKYNLPDSYDLYTGTGKIQVNLLLQIEL